MIRARAHRFGLKRAGLAFAPLLLLAGAALAQDRPAPGQSPAPYGGQSGGGQFSALARLDRDHSFLRDRVLPGQPSVQDPDTTGLSGLATPGQILPESPKPRLGIALQLALSQPVPFRVLALDDPPRLVVDAREIAFPPGAPDWLDQAGAARGLRWGRVGPGWSRLVIDMATPFRITAAWQETGAGRLGASPARLRVETEPLAAMDPAAPVSANPLWADPLWALPQPLDFDLAPKQRQTGQAPLIVALDPGHGGLDPGAEAAGESEAALMLAFARDLAELLRRAGMQVVLTRDEDDFLALDARVSRARAARADVLLSLHADALATGEAQGATIYRLPGPEDRASDRAATDPANTDLAAADSAGSWAESRLLAERHDRDDLLAGVDLAGQGDELAGLLMDLARTETRPRSARLADDLVAALRAADLALHRHPLQLADFTVLKAPDIPSVLIELGFLSSRADRARLQDPAWRARMQGAILAALQSWAEADAAEARLIRQ